MSLFDVEHLKNGTRLRYSYIIERQ